MSSSQNGSETNVSETPHGQDSCCFWHPDCQISSSQNGAQTARLTHRQALWRHTVHSADTFRLRFESPSNTVLMSELIRRSPYFWALDLLHILDYNGVTGQAIANLVVDVVRDGEFPGLTHGQSFQRLIR